MGNTATATRRHIQTQAMALPLPTAPLQAVDSGALTPARTTAARSVRQTAAPIKRKVQLIRVRSSSETETGPSGALPPPAKVFVAGATGATGQRVVRELLQRGIRVQAGVRNLDKAKSLLADAYAEDLDLVLRTPFTLGLAQQAPPSAWVLLSRTHTRAWTWYCAPFHVKGWSLNEQIRCSVVVPTRHHRPPGSLP